MSFIKKDLDQKEWFKNISILWVYSLATIFVVFPIADKGHFFIGATCSFISFIYLIYTILNKFAKENKIKKALRIYFNALAVIIMCIAIIYSVYLIITQYIQNDLKNTEYKHFKNIPIEEYLTDRMSKIDKLIIEKEKER